MPALVPGVVIGRSLGGMLHFLVLRVSTCTHRCWIIDMWHDLVDSTSVWTPEACLIQIFLFVQTSQTDTNTAHVHLSATKRFSDVVNPKLVGNEGRQLDEQLTLTWSLSYFIIFPRVETVAVVCSSVCLRPPSSLCCQFCFLLFALIDVPGLWNLKYC